ncbi:MAG: nuclear transport factor 2 family protein [Bacteroidales bacterium]|nr:nuclear transport factor 2 family protein [Bacteroidales bacterium]
MKNLFKSGLFVLLITTFSCTTSDKVLTDVETDKIKGEIKEVVDSYIKGCEEANFDMILEPFLNSPDFNYIFNGYSLGYDVALEVSKPAIEAIQNQEFTIVDEKYVFLDNSIVLYTLNCKFTVMYKDGHSELFDPCILQFVFTKVENDWKVISFVESPIIQTL